MNFRSFSKGDFFLILPTFSHSIMLLVGLRWREGHLCLYNRQPISMKLGNISNSWEPADSCLGEATAVPRGLPLSSCRKVGNGGCVIPLLPISKSCSSPSDPPTPVRRRGLASQADC